MLVKALNKVIYLNHQNKFWPMVSAQPKLCRQEKGGRGEREGHLLNVSEIENHSE